LNDLVPHYYQTWHVCRARSRRKSVWKFSQIRFSAFISVYNIYLHELTTDFREAVAIFFNRKNVTFTCRGRVKRTGELYIRIWCPIERVNKTKENEWLFYFFFFIIHTIHVTDLHIIFATLCKSRKLMIIY